ncbi:MAG TPA: ATP-binding protein [Chitinophagaceae bacterium]|nr:ATP-binding protein [Chitinophagaceae bacterium]
MRKHLTLLSFLLICLLGKAQTEVVKDSLVKLLGIAKDDSSKVKLYIELGNQYEVDDLQTAGKYYLLAGDLSKRLHYKRGIIKFISNYTYLLNVRGDFDSSLLLNKQGIQLSTEISDNLLLAKSLANTGNVFQYSNEYDSAVLYYEMAIKLFEQSNDKIMIASIGDALQNAYQQLNQNEKALRYGKEAVRILRAAGDINRLGQALLNTANSYQSLGYADSALTCYNEALTISHQLNHKRLESASLLGIGNLHLHHYDADSMKPYYEKALVLSRQMEDPDGESTALRGLALHYLLKKNFTEAKKNITDALAIADSLELHHEKVKNMKVLASILYGLHDVIAAEKCLDSASVIENRLAGDEVQEKTLVIEKKFETEKKEVQIKLQQAQIKQKNTLNYLLGAFALFAIVIGFFGYRNHQHKQKLQQVKIEELEKEKQLTAVEAVLKGEEQERSRLAKDLHDGLGGMLSGIKHSLNTMKGNLIMTPDNAQGFERSIDMLDSSIKEMRRVAHNMMPEVLVKFGLDTAVRDFCNDINQSGALQVNYQSIGLRKAVIEQTTSITIYRIIQELLNNIMKHAAAKNALVQVSKTNSDISITVEDDGKGFDTAILNDTKGLGWSNLRSRIDYLKGKMDVQSAAGAGTSILIELKA